MLWGFEREIQMTGTRLTEIRYTLRPSVDFVRLVRAANGRQRDGKETAESASARSVPLRVFPKDDLAWLNFGLCSDVPA